MNRAIEESVICERLGVWHSVKNRRGYWTDVACMGLLLLLPLLLFAPVALGGTTLLPADVLYLFQPYRAAATEMGVDGVQNALVGDLILQNYPWKQFLVNAFHSRTLPLWDPYLFSGHPFLANGQHSALYPLTWLFFLFPIPRAFGLFMVIQLGIAGLSMYGFARVIRAHRIGALIAGITFQLSGFMVISAVHPMIVAGASWLPLALACIECTVERRRFWAQSRTTLPWVLLGAGALGLQALTGHAETTYFVLLVMAGYAGWRLLHRLLTLERTSWRAEVLTPALGLVLMVGLGLALGAVQLMPFYETARNSFRQGAVSLEEVLGWAYPKRRLITFLIPNFFGNPTHTTLYDIFTGEIVQASRNAHGGAISTFDWGLKNYVEGAAYLGVLPLLLALIAVLRPPGLVLTAGDRDTNKMSVWRRVGRWIREPCVPFLTALSIFSLACIFGTPVYGLVYALPFLNQSHSPFRWVFPLTVAVSALAGLGATTVVKVRQLHGPQHRESARMTGGMDTAGAERTPRRSRLVRMLLWYTEPNLVSVVGSLAIWGGLLVAVGTVTSWLAFDAIEPVVTRLFWALARAAYAFTDARAFFAYLFPWTLTFAAFLLTSGIVLRVSRCSIWLPKALGRLPVWELLAVVVVVTDLVVFGAGFNPSVDPALLDYRPPVVDFLAQDTGQWRLSTFNPHGRNTFTANVSMFYGFQDVRGYDSLFSAQYARYMSWIEPQGQLLYNRIAPFTQFSSLDSPLTDMLNVKYILTEEEIPLPKYREVYRDAAVRVYENLGVVPRAFALPTASTLVAHDITEVGKITQSYDPRYYAVVEATMEGWTGPVNDTGLVNTSGEINVPGMAASPEPVTPHPQTVTAYGINEVVIETTVDEPSWLILTDAFAPGWKAFVRPPGTGQDQEMEVPIARVAGNFRGIVLEEAALVRFKYTPNSVKIGAFISFLGGMMILFLTVVWTWRLIYREREQQTAVQRLAKNSIAPIVLNFFNRIVDFAFAALMLRILGPANVGDYYYAGYIYVWFDILTNFGLNTYLTREVSRHPQQARRYLVSTTLFRLGLSLIGVPLLLSFVGVRQSLIADLMGAPASRQAILSLLLLYLGLIPNSISTGLTALFYAYEKAEYPAMVTSLTTLVRVTIQTLVLIVGGGIMGLAASTFVINLVPLAVLGLLAWRLFPALRKGAIVPDEGRPALDRRLYEEMARESWPLMLNHLFATLFFKIDVFLMESILGSEMLGRYQIGYKLLEALMVIPSMFTLALFPVISRHAQDDRETMARFYRLGAKILVLLAWPAALITTVLAREMVLILGGPEYLPGAMVALRLMAWSMPISWINGITQYVLIALNRQRYLTRAYVLGFSFSLVANLLLMPRFGYRASALLHIFAELVLFIPFMIGVRRDLRAIGWWSMLGKPVLAAVAAGGAGWLLLGLGHFAAVAGVLIVYAALVWFLRVLNPEERATLAPLLRRTVKS